MRFYLFLCFVFIFGGVTAQEVNADSSAENHTKIGYATYYAKRFEGHRTTSGERYRAAKYTAAHLRLPFGTRVKVTNLKNGKSVVVKVNDRGPHSRKFMIDLSRSAAKKIGILGKGYDRVKISY